MQRLTGVRELLDGPLDDDQALVGNLRDLARANRWLGGRELSSKGLAVLAPGEMPVTMIDIGTGGADIPLALLDEARGTGRRLSVTATDGRAEILDAAMRREPRLGTTADLTLCVADGRSLPFGDRTFDIAHASLLLHHLDPTAAVEVLREMGRVARRGIVVNDLVRARVAWVGAWLLSHLATTNRYTRHDAPMSVGRAYTVAELTALIAAAGLRVEASTVGGPFGHRVVLAARAAGSPGTGQASSS